MKQGALLKGALLILTILTTWMAVRIVELENYRYASSIGMCKEADIIERDKCLQGVQTRTHWLWHLAYGLKLL